MALIEIKNLSFSYSDSVILDDVNIEIENGDFVGIIGSNGSGKSTLLRLILGLLKANKGTILINTKNVAYVSQTMMNFDSTFPATVKEIISLGIIRPFGYLNANDKKNIDRVLKLLNIENLKNKQISNLSGGEQQKVKLAKALVNNPDLIILDEPTAGMDNDSELLFTNTLWEMHNQGKTILCVAHRMETLEKATTIYILRNKQVIKHV